MELNIPLEKIDPKIFGELDNDQKFFIENDALDLVLMENASELVRQVMMDSDVIEKTLDKISRKSLGCTALPSQTFPYWYPDDGTQRYNNNNINQKDRVAFDEIVYEFKRVHLNILKNIPKIKRRKTTNDVYSPKCIILIVAIDLDSSGVGHYGALYYNKETDSVRVFDSMQIGFGSAYTPCFKYIAKRIFDTDNITVPECITSEMSLQITGGFSDNYPFISPELTFRWNMLSENQRRLYSSMATESQNHYCYIWSIWYLHHLLVGKDPFESIKNIHKYNLDPLIVIKRYIWGLFTTPELKLIDKIPKKYIPFFERHWGNIWTDSPTRKQTLLTPFRAYRVSMPLCRDVNECLERSLDVDVKLCVL